MRAAARKWKDPRRTAQARHNPRRRRATELVSNQKHPAGRGAALMSETLENLYSETRQFPPPAELAADANVKVSDYDAAEADRLGYWARQAERLTWTKRWDQVLDWSNPPFARWFVGGELN